MTLAIKTDGTWAVLPYGQDVTSADGTQASYATVSLWSEDERNAFGVFSVPDPAAPPDGKVEASRVLGGDAAPAWSVTYMAPPQPSKDALKAAVMTKRDAVIGGGFTFNSVVYQTGDTDRENISGAAQLAFMAIVAGAQAGNLRWADPNTDFGWIATDNSVVPMDAQTVVSFGKACAGFKQACIFHARDLKDQIDAAADPASIDINAGWPTS